MSSAPSGFLSGLYETVANCIGPVMSGTPVPRTGELHNVLDAADGDQPMHAPAGPTAAGASSAGDGADLAASLHAEQQARLQAEADVADRERRLSVAQIQLAEYASQKESDASSLLGDAQELRRQLLGLLGGGGGEGEPQQLRERAEQLCAKMGEYVRESKAFAEQQRSDLENAKRGSEQTLPGSDVEMKRPREAEAAEAEEADGEAMEEAEPAGPPSSVSTSETDFKERAKYIPLRLNMEERRLLRLLEACLSVSEYTDKVDIQTWRSKTARIHAQIKDICAILSGLVVAQNYKKGQQLVQDRNFADNAVFFQDCFEVGRRHKVMNPEKMRSDYGKLIYMLQDSQDNQIQSLLEFQCVRPLRTVHSLLEAAGGLALLDDPLMSAATAEIIAGDRPRIAVQRDIKNKERAREALAKKYSSSQLSQDNILLCLYSIGDNNSYLLFNRDPVDKMISYLKEYFRPDISEPGYSLAISGGSNGARLTHNHERQYNYVLQSLSLWREISNDMFKLWYLAESDLLKDNNSYRLTDTGQGLNRVQQAPQTSNAIHLILARCQRQIGSWVGSSVVHLGDHNVPNALMFIDKYTQVPRILNPVVLIVEEIPKLARDPNIAAYIDATFGSTEACRRAILADFFRHAFDGSGADNFFDAGSCIDGRLTSAWNWCSKVEKKKYHPLFKMAGFVGFDGEFQK